MPVPTERFGPSVPVEEIEMVAIRAQGPGGQNVNKVSNAVQLRFDIARSSLPGPIRQRLLASRDSRITSEGVLVLRAQRFRSLELNRADALAKVQAMIDEAAHVPRARRATRPTLASQRRRVEAKSRRGAIKAGRGAVRDE
jgi:ribosome-associated protein